ncbi:uncharacterized protein A1O9_09318 [Exophiala aquamarina CBS 119918]|uniref:Uncharacterized protein n=1 Tax=Exophiala aquamarina CBS 119918 TaxID=1182545 RepID=A0A072PH80_9EURO|nr:uncharacterized protein A1O9_09318 [Exophiala aquamarina CBS 119918]KEF54875.1 hypothetical protein A1O9_09318 [Exophiala aquamarina CBS 119918]
MSPNMPGARHFNWEYYGQRDLKGRGTLDDDGGSTVHGKLITPSSLAIEGSAIGLAHEFVLKKDVKRDHFVSWQVIEYGEESQTIRVRREVDASHRKELAGKGFETMRMSYGTTEMRLPAAEWSKCWLSGLVTCKCVIHFSEHFPGNHCYR